MSQKESYWPHSIVHLIFARYLQKYSLSYLIWNGTKSTLQKKKRLPSWELILLLKKSEELSKKRSKKLERNKEYFKTTLLIEFDVPRYTSKRIRKREQNWRKSRINCDFLSRHKQRIAFQSSWQPPISAN